MTSSHIIAALLLTLSAAWPASAAPTPFVNQEPYLHPQQLVEIAPGRRLKSAEEQTAFSSFERSC